MSVTRTKDYPQFPHCSANHVSLYHPIKFKLTTESLLSAPRSAIIDGIISYGGSTSIGLKLPRKAYGEYHERNHLFTKIPVNDEKPLSEIQPASYQNKLLGLCKTSKGTQDALDHRFSWTRVYNLFNNEPQDYFYNGIALNCNKKDSLYINFSDSCACAAHPNKERALYNSLMEFLERQALLGSWLSKTYQYTINPTLLREVTPYRHLVDMFLDNGELFIFQNGNQLPGQTVIMFYFSKSKDDLVQYSIGSSTGLSLAEAMASSFEELYQCYSFLYNAECSEGLENKAGAGYHLAFQSCNSQSVRETIPFMQNIRPFEVKSLDELEQVKKFTEQEILDELSKLSSDIFYYHAFEKSLNLHYTKILSPDFFVHMSLNNSLNIENSYAGRLNISKANAYLEKIPFP